MVRCFLVYFYFFCELLIIFGILSKEFCYLRWSYGPPKRVCLCLCQSPGGTASSGSFWLLIPGFIFFWPCWVASTWSSYLKGKFPTFLYPVSMMISFLAVRGSSTLCWGPLGVSASSPVQESCPPPVHPSEHRLKVRVSRVWRRLPGFLLSLLRSL